MMAWWNIYLMTFVAALVFSLALTPFFRQVAIFLNFYDHPKVQNHKKHSTSVPLMGGAALCVSWLLTIILGIAAAKTYLIDTHLDKTVTANLPGIFTVSRELIAICLGAVLITLFGLYDDIHNMRAKTKFAGQFVVAAIAATWGGVKISLFLGSPFLCWGVTVFWILLVMNAINFFDNMDGLAIGVATIAFSLFSISAAISGQHFVAVFGSAMAGAGLGFWFYNHSPATIFMGDSGSHLIGYNLAVLGALVTYYNPVFSNGSKLSIFIPLFVLAIPLFDLAAVVVIRWHLKKPFYIGDNNHISHRFVHTGMTKKSAVFAVHLIALAIGLGVLPLMWGNSMTTIVCLLQACTILILVSVLQYSSLKVKHEKTEKN